jgi:hypothetical protein
MENKTQMGLLLLIFGMVLTIFSTLGNAAAGSLSGSAVTPGVCIPAILSFFALILLFIGWLLMLLSRTEFGEEHAKFVIYSLIAFIIGFIIVIIGGVISAIGMISGGLGGIDPDANIDYVAMARGMKAGMMVSEVGGILFTIGAILLVFRLENDIGKKVLFLALIVSIIISIVAMIYISSALDELADRLEDTPEEDREEEFTEGLSAPSLIGGLDVIGLAILMIGYIIPYNRIKNGDLRPKTPPPPAYGMPPYPPSYPYQPYPPYQQPPYQPPYQPPQQPQATPEEMARPEPSPRGAVQPMAVSPEPVGIKKCMFCASQIPAGSTTCPVCKKELK